MSKIYRSEAGAHLLRENYRKALEHWPTENEQFHVPTPEGDTFVIVSGPATAPPLLLFHGSGGNSSQWISAISDFAPHFRVYAVDMIGEPGFSAPSRPPLDSDRHAVWLDAVLDHFGLTQVSIMAVSLGGWLALDYATRREGRVQRLALSCPGGIGRQKTGFLLKSILLNLLGRGGKRKSVTEVFGPVLSTMTPADAAAIIDQVLLVSENYRYRTEKLPVFDDEALRKLTMPVHVLVGEMDVMMDSAETKRRLEAAAPHVTVRLLPGVGHHIPAQAAELEFLTNVSQGERQA
jgi:pimeloyl-ACP methyl ester carboxylesterase